MMNKFLYKKKSISNFEKNNVFISFLISIFGIVNFILIIINLYINTDFLIYVNILIYTLFLIFYYINTSFIIENNDIHLRIFSYKYKYIISLFLYSGYIMPLLIIFDILIKFPFFSMLNIFNLILIFFIEFISEFYEINSKFKHYQNNSHILFNLLNPENEYKLLKLINTFSETNYFEFVEKSNSDITIIKFKTFYIEELEKKFLNKDTINSKFMEKFKNDYNDYINNFINNFTYNEDIVKERYHSLF